MLPPPHVGALRVVISSAFYFALTDYLALSPPLLLCAQIFFPLGVPSFACVKCPALISFSFKTIPEISQCYWFTDGLMVPVLVFHCCVVCLSHSSGT